MQRFTAQDAALVQQGTAAAVGGLSDSVAAGMSAQAGTGFGAYGFEFSYSAAGGFEFVRYCKARKTFSRPFVMTCPCAASLRSSS